jgi:hypothetical protein
MAAAEVLETTEIEEFAAAPYLRLVVDTRPAPGRTSSYGTTPSAHRGGTCAVECAHDSRPTWSHLWRDDGRRTQYRPREFIGAGFGYGLRRTTR